MSTMARPRGACSPELLLLLVMALAALVATACDPGPYGACTLPSSEALDDACSSGGSSSGETEASSSCVIDFVFECESQLCGTFRGSDPFCTERCSGPTDTSCPQSGVCLEWVPGLGEYYCVPQDLAPPGSVVQ